MTSINLQQCEVFRILPMCFLDQMQTVTSNYLPRRQKQGLSLVKWPVTDWIVSVQILVDVLLTFSSPTRLPYHWSLCNLSLGRKAIPVSRWLFTSIRSQNLLYSCTPMSLSTFSCGFLYDTDATLCNLGIYKFMICVLLPINLDQLTCLSSLYHDFCLRSK
jgi:hypothetical protein